MGNLNALVAPLSLVYPPFTNQEAIWLAEDTDTIERLRLSDIYMIAARAQASFGDHQVVSGVDGNLLRFDIHAGEINDTFELDIGKLLADRGVHPSIWAEAEIELAPNGIRLWVPGPSVRDSNSETLVEFFTPEKLVYDRGLGMPGISGLDRVREFSTYDLLYVGIAKESDTFERLIKGSHDARQKILGAEFPRRVGARVSDEILFFAFNIDHFAMRVLAESDVMTSENAAEARARDRAVTADAEKAFIAILEPAYNSMKYLNYPSGADGLYSAGLASYGFFLAENVTFRTASIVFKGATRATWHEGNFTRIFANGGHVITVSGDDVVISQT